MKLHTKSLPGAAWALGLALLLLLALALLPAPAYADEVSPYGLYVGGTAITSDGQVVNGTGGTATFTVGQNAYTLTLDAYVYSGEGYNHANYRAALFYNGAQDLTIVLKGESSLTTSGAQPYVSHGMYFNNSHSINSADNPKLTIQSVSGGSLKSVGKNASTDSYGISTYSYDLLLDGADVVAVGGDAGSNSVALDVTDGTLEISSGAYLAAYSGTAQNASSIGVSCRGRVVVSGGTLDAWGDTAGNGAMSCGICISPSSKTEAGLSVTGGRLTATGMGQAIKLNDGVSLSADGMMIQAGESKSARETVTGDGWKNRKFVKISPPTYDLWIGGEEVTPANSSHLDSAGHGWSFDPTSYTLTLNAYTYAGEGLKSVGLYHNYYDALHYEGTHALTIDLVGDNCLTQQGGTGYSWGIVFAEGQAAVTIQSASGGTLTVNAVGDSAKTTIRYGIDTGRPLTISGAAVTVNIPSNDNGVIAIGVMHSAALRIEGGSLKAVSGKSVTSVGISQASNTAAVTLSGASSLIACTLDDDNASDKCAISSHDSLNPDPGMTVLAGAAADSAGVVSGDGWKNQKYVKIFKQYGLWIGEEEEVTSAKLSGVGNVDGKKGTWTFTPANPETGTPHTLTLNGYNYDGPGYLFYSDASLINYAALYYSGADNLVIELVGDNSITRRGIERSFAVCFDSSATVTIRSDSGGTLTVNAVGDPTEHKDRFGINTYGNLCITDAAVTVNAGPTSGSAWTSGVCYMKQLLIDGGSLKAVGGDYGYYTDGIYATSNNASLTVKNGGSLLAVAGKGQYSRALVGTMNSSVTVSGDSTLVAYTTADDTATTKCAINNVTLSAPGMTIRAGASEGESSVVTGDGWKNQNYVKIYKPYNLWVGGEEVTSTNLSHLDGAGHGWSFDPDAYTLTLDTYVYDGPGYSFASLSGAAAAGIYYIGNDALTVELAGESEVTVSGTQAIENIYGIYCAAPSGPQPALSITGPDGATLTVNAGSAYWESTGLYTEGDLEFHVDDATFSGDDAWFQSNGISCGGNLTVYSGFVYAYGGDADIFSTGVYMDGSLLTVTGGGFLYATGGTAGYWSGGVDCDGDILVQFDSGLFARGGGTVKAAPDDRTYSAGIHCHDFRIGNQDANLGPRTIVTVFSGDAENSICIDCDHLNVYDATLFAMAMDGVYRCGVDCTAMDLKGGFTIVSVTAEDGDAFCFADLDSCHVDSVLAYYALGADPADAAVFFAALDRGETLPYARFAAWETVEVIFDAGGGSFSGGNATLTRDVHLGATLAEAAAGVQPTRSGYSLAGWSLSAGGAALADSETLSNDTTLYALWTANYYGGGDSLPPAPKAAETAHGSVSFDPKNPAKGTKVTVTATPDAGYELESLTAKDAAGKDVALTENADGTWSFTQGDKQITVTAKFKAKETADPLAAFTDLDPKAWYADDVRWALTEGVMEGYGNGLFGPGDTVSRGMVMAVLWKLEGRPVVNFAMPFTDVAADDWYAEAVRWAASIDLVTGYEDGSFCGEQAVTREELTTMLYRYAKTRGLGFTGMWMFRLDFPDASDVSDWALESVSWMVMQDVINGMDGRLNPRGSSTRAQLAAMLRRFDAQA